MATLTTPTQSSSSTLQPQTPPRLRKKKSDPFLELPAAPTVQSEGQQQQQDSLISRILLAPLSLLSFIISLFLVDRATRQYRAQSSLRHSPTQHSLLSYFSPSAWLAGPEPYQDPVDTTWGVDGAPDATGQSGKWFVRKKHRKTAKLALMDAFEMMDWVLIGLIAMGVGVIMSMAWVAWEMYR